MLKKKKIETEEEKNIKDFLKNNNNKYNSYRHYNSFNNIKKGSISSKNSKIKSNNKINGNISLVNNKSKSLRDIILNSDKEMPKKIYHKSEMNKNGNDIYNNNYIETPHFVLNQKSLNSNDLNKNINDIKKHLNLLSLTLPRESFKNSFSSRKNYQNFFDLKKRIISQSSSLLHNERRMINLVEALNKMTIKNTSSNKNNYSKEEENNKDITNSNTSKRTNRIISNRKNRYLFFDQRITLGDNDNEEIFKKKYPEPDDIDMNLVNISNENDIFKNNRTIIKIDNDKNKNDYSNDTLYFINNNRNNNSKINNNYYNKSSSFSIIKDNHNINNNSSITKDNNSNYMYENNFNINEKTNLENTSIEGQISHLENNINKFEKNFWNIIGAKN